MSRNRFAVVPVDVLMDSRLTFRQMRVLLALFAFRNKKTNLAWPSREQLAELTNLPRDRVSVITSELEGMGWVKKMGNGGRSKATRYELRTPKLKSETLTETVTVSEAETLTDLAETLTESVSETLTETVRGIEQTNEQTNEQTKGKRVRATLPAKPDDVADQVWADWLELRKAKRAPVTQTVIDGARREANKAGMSLDAFLREWCVRGSQGLRAAWLAERRDGPRPVQQHGGRYAAAAVSIFGPMPSERAAASAATASAAGEVIDV